MLAEAAACAAKREPLGMAGGCIRDLPHSAALRASRSSRCKAGSQRPPVARDRGGPKPPSVADPPWLGLETAARGTNHQACPRSPVNPSPPSRPFPRNLVCFGRGAKDGKLPTPTRQKTQGRAVSAPRNGSMRNPAETSSLEWFGVLK